MNAVFELCVNIFYYFLMNKQVLDNFCKILNTPNVIHKLLV